MKEKDDNNNEKEVQIEYQIKCVCCGKQFSSTDPKVDTCYDCMLELADLL